MHVANDVERAMLVPAIVPERLTLDDRRVNFVRSGEAEDVRKAFALEPAQRSSQLLRLISHHVRPKLPIRSAGIALVTEPFRHIENDGDREDVVLARDLDQRFAGFRLNVRCVDHREPATAQALVGDRMNQIEGLSGRGLIILIVSDEAAAGMGRDNLRGEKVLARTMTFRNPMGR